MLNKIKKHDERKTPPEIITPLLPFLKDFEKNINKKPIIWCPFDKEDSYYVKIFKENWYNVVYSHIEYWQNFFEYEPLQRDIIISNPPFSNKKLFFKRAIELWKPFCLLSPIWWLNDKTPYDLFKDVWLQLIIPDIRINFIWAKKERPSFKSVYYCRNFLIKKDIEFISLRKK